MLARLRTLFDAVRDIEGVFILPHNNPDPDSLAAAVTLQYLLEQRAGVACQVTYSGIIGRAENKALARYLDLLPVDHNQQQKTGAFVPAAKEASHVENLPVILIDTQPEAGNIILPDPARIVAVIDHHNQLSALPAVPYVDIRTDVGATSTILVEYIKAAELPIQGKLATALFYGIKTNTMSLSRNVGPADAKAYHYLQPQIDVKALSKIEQAKVPLHYFRTFDSALRQARLYKNLIFSNLGEIEYPDLTAEIADWLLRLEQARWVICVGLYHQTMVISVRARHRQDNAERLALAITEGLGAAGGHGTIAGGQIQVGAQSTQTLISTMVQQALLALKIPLDTASTTLFVE